MDKILKMIFMTVVIPPLVVASGSASNEKPPKCPSWDIFLFVQEWPPSICSVSECKKVPSYVNGWTIHGLWSNRKDDTCDVEYCNNSWKFDWDKIKVLKPELESRWPSLLARDKQKHIFWQQEWNRHGTCAASVPAIGSEYLYFKKGLDLNSRFNMTRAFEEMKIVPSCKKPINACSIQKAIRAYFKLPYYPPIRSFMHGRRRLVSEIHICMKKDFTIDACRTHVTECLSDIYMYLYPFNTKCT